VAPIYNGSNNFAVLAEILEKSSYQLYWLTFICYAFVCVCDRVSLCSPGWTWTCYHPASASWVLRLQMCTTTPDSCALLSISEFPEYTISTQHSERSTLQPQTHLFLLSKIPEKLIYHTFCSLYIWHFCDSETNISHWKTK
jgi:hypothetical protein